MAAGMQPALHQVSATADRASEQAKIEGCHGYPEIRYPLGPVSG
jgi:hypothetical protein